MCGIAGVLAADPSDPDELAAQAQAMGDALRHRGPDDAGVWADPAGHVAFAQQRLAIIDLSPAGHQPMISADGRFVIDYNGEIYNTEELRAELRGQGCSFRGHSDTEVILEGCARWGIRATIERLVGMFAIAVWDRQHRTLRLVRDRLGIKPLYYGHLGGRFRFASELRAFTGDDVGSPAIDPQAIAHYLHYGFVPAPLSILRAVRKLQPGTILCLEPGGEPRFETFWSLDAVAAAGRSDPFTGSETEAIEQLDALLFDATRRRLVADVPVGAFLSGGIDSSTVVALMQRASAGAVQTFSIGFDEPDCNEAPYAAAVARHLGTEHTELYVSSSQALDLIPRLPEVFDEPFGDASGIPTYFVSELARRTVTVALSGDGGDELFGGYRRYLQAAYIRRMSARLPAPARRAVAAGLNAVPRSAWDRLGFALPALARGGRTADTMEKLAASLTMDEAALYRRFVTQWEAPGEVVLDATSDRGDYWDGATFDARETYLDRMRFWDTRYYLPDDILTKVDRASMAVGLEARVPILDHRVVEFAWRLPAERLVQNGAGKRILRQVLDRYVPRDLVDRPKKGFGVPIAQWLRGPLEGWAGDLLEPSRLQRQGLIDPEPVRRYWQEHRTGRRDRHFELWNVLMLQAWLDAR